MDENDGTEVPVGVPPEPSEEPPVEAPDPQAWNTPEVPEEPEPDPEPAWGDSAGKSWQPDLCRGTKKDGTPCMAMQKGKTGFCVHHQPKVERMESTSPRRAHSDDKLKAYPFHDGGVNENAAIRMIRMVIPQCPIDAVPELRQKDGTYKPNPLYTGEPNCQQAFKLNNHGRWDVARCEALGHDPWHTKFRRPIVEEVVDKDGFVTETRTRYKLEERLNVIQVSDNVRHTNGTEVQLALAKGCRFLEDFGYASPCEFRNCTQPQRIDTRFGKYCSERHARLIAADKLKKMLPIGGDPFSEDQAREEREDMLATLNIRRGG